MSAAAEAQPVRLGRRRLWALLGALMLSASPASAETRVETLSGDLIPKNIDVGLVEVDVANKAALGFRGADLGDRSGTNEFYLRLERGKRTSALDPRDQRKAGMNNPLSAFGALHVGVVGVETDGTRGMPMALRLGTYSLSRLSGKMMGVTELSYQTGTFGGDASQRQNKGGLFGRVGVRQPLSNRMYAEGAYTFAPGTDEDFTPRVRVGMTF